MKSLFFLLPLLFLASDLPGHDAELKNVAKTLRQNARKTRMEKEFSFAIADREEMLEMGLERKSINPAEERKIKSSLRKLRTMERSMKAKGSLSARELQKFREELAYCYHLIYFANRKEGEFTYTLEGGEKFYLLPEYQRRADRASLSRKDMKEIHKVMNRVWLLRSRMKNPNFPKKERQRLLEDCAALLTEKYFTDQKPVLTEKTKKGKKK